MARHCRESQVIATIAEFSGQIFVETRAGNGKERPI